MRKIKRVTKPRENRYDIVKGRKYYYMSQDGNWIDTTQGKYNFMESNNYVVSYTDNERRKNRTIS